ncbi:MAG: hypothetical protein K2Q45_03825 [Nitrosomonas sp.]|nr:hypothetical protein [Nitrosomonas sp.]
MHTKEELNSAQTQGLQEIIIEGDLAEKVRNGKKVNTIGKVTAIALGVAIATIPITGGISSAAFVPVAIMTGLELALVIAIAFVGLGLLTAIWKEYEEVEFSYNPLRLKLRKKV